MDGRMREMVAEGAGMRGVGAFEAVPEMPGLARDDADGTRWRGFAKWPESGTVEAPEAGIAAGLKARGTHRALDAVLFFLTPEDSARGRGFAPETRVSRALGAAKAGFWAIVAVLSVIAFAS